MAWQKVRIEIPNGFSPELREEIGEAMIVMIKDRSALGTGVKPSGKYFKTYNFPEYSKKYAERKGSTRVDLVYDDVMLNDIRVLSHKADSILIGFENGSKENAKAEGNQLGSYGRSPDSKKARRFLGITKEELDAILAAYPEGES